MRRSSLGVALVIGLGVAVSLASGPGCSGGVTNLFPDGGGPGSGSGSSSGEGGIISLGHDGGQGLGSGSGSGHGGGTVCPSGLSCDVSCSGSATTTISGKVYDPAGKVPLYDIAVYVPAKPLVALPTGVPTGAEACSCSALFPSGAIVNTTTGVDGSFTLKNAPVGSKVPLVLQVGKWRRSLTINVTACQNNAQADKSLTLPGTVASGDTDNNMPDIAVSTGSADTLECLLVRMGVAEAEYVAGASGSGHVHIFSGGQTGGGHGGGGMIGQAETPAMAGAPVSSKNLWDSQAHLMPYDILLLSCEGGETYNAIPQNLEAYLNAGGRAFASHFHYAWFAGPIGTGQSYSAPSDWGNNLASWAADTGGGMTNTNIGGIIVQTLNGTTKPFPKGTTLSTWLDENGALGTNGVGATELSIFQPRYNAVVGAGNKPSQPWITADAKSGHSGSTMYFSFDTPVNAPAGDGGSPAYCGRAVFSDLHVAGAPSTSGDGTTAAPPKGCLKVDLSPQEKALEFMLFDLSSCVLPDTVAPSADAGISIPK